MTDNKFTFIIFIFLHCYFMFFCLYLFYEVIKELFCYFVRSIVLFYTFVRYYTFSFFFVLSGCFYRCLYFLLDNPRLHKTHESPYYRPVTNSYSHTAQISPGRKSLHEPLFVSDGFTIRSVLASAGAQGVEICVRACTCL